jgi:hypothetical protein
VNAEPHSQSTARRLTRGLAVLLAVCGTAGFFLGRNHFELRTLALIASIAGGRLSLIGRSAGASGNDSYAASQPIRRRYWFVGVVLAALTAVSFYALIRDAKSGYHDILPVYAFGAAVLVFAAWAGILAARLSK